MDKYRRVRSSVATKERGPQAGDWCQRRPGKGGHQVAVKELNGQIKELNRQGD